MPLLNRIRENFKARAESKRQATNQINNPENEYTSSESVPQQNFALLDEAFFFEERIFEENVTWSTTRQSTQLTSNFNSRVTEESSISTSTSGSTNAYHRTLSTWPSQATTLRGPALHNDLSEDLDNEDVGDDDSSSASPSPVSRSHDNSNMSSRPSITRHGVHQTKGLHRQWMNNRRRINHRSVTYNNNNLSAEHHSNFDAPLERVDAKPPHPSLSTEMQDQVGNHVG